MKKWLTERFLPMWAKETVLKDNRDYRRQIRYLQQRLQEREAYIRGLEMGLRAVKRKQ